MTVTIIKFVSIEACEIIVAIPWRLLDLYYICLHSPAGDIQVTHCEALHDRVLEEITLTVTVVHGKLQSQFWGFCASDENSVHF